MFTVNRVPNCAAVIRNLTFKFISRLGVSCNALVCSIIDSDLKFISIFAVSNAYYRHLKPAKD